MASGGPSRGTRGDSTDPLNRGGTGVVDDQILIGDNSQPSPNHLEEFTRLEQEVGVRWETETLVAAGICLIDQRSAPRDRRDQIAKDGTVKVVGHHEARERATAEREGLAVLQVDLGGLEPRVPGEVGDPGQVDVDGDDRVA